MRSRTRILALAMSLLGAGGLVLASVLPHSDCPTFIGSNCRIIAPQEFLLWGWLPGAMLPMASIVIVLVSAIGIARSAVPGGYVAGVLTATGFFAIVYFYPHAFRVGIPDTDLVHPYGIIGMVGGALAFAGGLLELVSQGRASS